MKKKITIEQQPADETKPQLITLKHGTRNVRNTSRMKGIKSTVGETIEAKMRRVMSNKEPIKDTSPEVYTEREDGVVPNLNIRTDKWEHAIEHKDNEQKSKIAKREMHIGERTYDTMNETQRQEFHTKYPDHKFSIAAKNASEGKP